MLRALVGEDDFMPQRSGNAEHEAGELLGQLARELSALVRRDVEVAAAERLSTLRTALLDIAAVLGVAVAVLFALAAGSVAGGRALAAAIPGWLAALCIAGMWLLVAIVAGTVLLRPRTRRREREVVGLLQMLASEDNVEQLRASREEARDEAETEMRRSSGALVETLLDEAVEHHMKALPSLAKREVGKAEVDAAEVLADAFAMLTAPARAGLHALGRLVEPPPAPDGEKRPTSPARYTRGGS